MKAAILLCALCVPLALVIGIARTPAEKPEPAPKHTHKMQELDKPPILSKIEVKLERPRRLRFDAEGNLIIVDSGAGTVLKRSPKGKVTTLADELNEPSGLAIDAEGNIYVSTHAEGEEEAGTIVRIDAKGKKKVLADKLTGAKGLAFDGTGNLYIALFEPGEIKKLDKKGKLTTFVEDVPTPAGLVFDKDGNLFAVNSVAGTVTRISPKGKAETYAKGLTIPSDIAMSPKGVVTVTSYGGTEVTLLDAKGVSSTLMTVPEGTIGVQYDTLGNLFLVNWDHQLLFERTEYLSLPCPHCNKTIPVHLGGGEKPKKRADL